jgi:hypothetical protein
MRHLYITLAIILSGLFSFSQTYNEDVEYIINEVNQDSLIFYLRNLSGEDSVMIDGEKTIIEHRVSNWGNNLAASYLKQTFEGFGLTTYEQVYSGSGKNIYAVQEGLLYPDEYYMICAHYDAVDYYCADDNASGSTAVLESARIFSDLQFDYSIIYALWDEEEIGLIGSDYYASQAASNGDIIHGVINMDMIAWDGDGDMAAEIHTSFQANSTDLSDYIVEIKNIYELPVTTNIQLPGTSASDHSRFWNNGYAAVLMIEEYFGGDFNPYYHSELDRIGILQMTYFHEMSKLCIGSLASMAGPVISTSIESSDFIAGIRLMNYPNPFSNQTNISYTLPGESFVKISIVNSVGKEIAILDEGYRPGGEHQLKLNAASFQSGFYFLCVKTAEGLYTHKLVIN